MDFGLEVEVVGAAAAPRGGGPFTYAIHGQDGRLGEGGGEKGSGRVGLVVLREEDLALEAEFLADKVGDPELFLEPEGHGHEKAAQAEWGITEIGFEDALEFEQGFLVKYDVINICNGHSGLLQAGGDSLAGKIMIVFNARKALLLGGGEDFAVLDEGCGAVMIETG
ncbi:MAG: hypothetical protein BWY77_01683 [bacterium ADurb.Bin431]|nr:MAG: hypothetical protein BWY77_01683 [bacterium ADurb.Bin431]